MKNIFLLIASIVVLSACNKDEFHSRRLYVGEGRWAISSIQYQNFDSTGTVTHDSSVSQVMLGELVFFKSESLSGLYDYRLGVWIQSDTAGTHGYSFEYVFDGERIDIHGIDGALLIDGVYTSKENKKRRQVWETTGVKAYGINASTLKSKTTMTLKKE